MPRLVVEEAGKETVLDLAEQAVTIGRDLGNEIVIHDRMSSRLHCRVSLDDRG